MANAFQTVDWMSMEALDLLTNKLAIANHFTTDFEREFERDFAPGESIRIKKPQKFTVRNGLGYTPQPLQRIYQTVNLDQVFGVDFEWDSYEKAVMMERSEAQLRTEYIEPAVAQLAQEIESRAALWGYQNTNNIVGVLGTDPTDFDTTSAAARQRMMELACPNGGDRGAFVAPNIMRALKKSAISYFNPAIDVSKQYRDGIVGSGDGFTWYESVSLYAHTAGTWAGGVTVTTAPASGASSIVLTCTTGDTFNQGDVIGFQNTNQVNNMTRRKLTTVQKPFVVTAAVVGAASSATVAISPAIYGPGSQYQNVDALPIAGATVTLFPGTGSPNGKSGVNHLFVHPKAFALVGVPLEMPKAVEVSKQQTDPNSGISISFVRAFDPIQRKMVNRFDVLLGFGNLYSDECSVRLLGA